MTGLNSFVRTMTGPRLLSSALKEKTAPIQRVIEALDGQSELRTSIPASVFGGDIFGVMSEQLRDALVVPPPAGATVVNSNRRRSLSAPANPTTSFLKNLLLPTDSLKQPTLPVRPVDGVSSTALPTVAPEEIKSSRKLGNSPSVPHASPLTLLQHITETPSVPSLKTTELMTSSKVKQPGSTTLLVNSLKRYWQSMRETRDTTRASPTTHSAEPPRNSRDLAVSEFEPQVSPRAWPSFAARDSKRPSWFAGDTDRTRPNPTVFDSFSDAEPQQNFNFNSNPANHHASPYDDLGERLAEILHEQALQHGIDVT